MSVNGFDDSKNRKEVYTKEEINLNVQKEEVAVDQNGITGKLIFKRQGNIVNCYGSLYVPENTEASAMTENIPEWAKVIDTTDTVEHDQYIYYQSGETVFYTGYAYIDNTQFYFQAKNNKTAGSYIRVNITYIVD